LPQELEISKGKIKKEIKIEEVNFFMVIYFSGFQIQLKNSLKDGDKTNNNTSVVKREQFIYYSFNSPVTDC
jgi:hypothetical protein